MAAETRSDLTFACRALDRLFRAGRYWVPQWYNTSHRLAYWDQFGHPANLPRYPISDSSSGVGERTLWWYDGAKAAKLEQAK
jgi:microcin C transport system substrate-binding protein